MSRQSYRDLIQAGADQLRLAGLADPVREARRLLQLTTDFSATTLISCETDDEPICGDFTGWTHHGEDEILDLSPTDIAIRQALFGVVIEDAANE